MRRASGETRSSVAVALDALGAGDDALVPLLALAPGTLPEGAPPLPDALGTLLEAAVLAGEALVVAPASSISAISAPTLTVSSSFTRILTTRPETGEGYSAVTLSVMISTSGSSRLMASPSCFSQRPTVPSETDSPSWGMVIRVDMECAPLHCRTTLCGLRMIQA